MRRLPEVGGIITAEQVLQTAESIAAIQEPDGGVPWPEGHVDAWNHIECHEDPGSDSLAVRLNSTRYIAPRRTRPFAPSQV